MGFEEDGARGQAVVGGWISVPSSYRLAKSLASKPAVQKAAASVSGRLVSGSEQVHQVGARHPGRGKVAACEVQS